MDQADFRKLLNSDAGSANASAAIQKRSRGQAFGVRADISQTSKSFLAPRTKRRSTGPVTTEVKTETSTPTTSKSRQARSLLAAGYVDRTKQRHDSSVKDDNQQKLDELRDDLKQKRITHKEYLEKVETFAKGDFSQSGIVRGLDRKLLERVRAGEDVLGQKEEVDASKTEEELDQVLESLERSSKVDGPTDNDTRETSPVPASKTRDSLLARMKNPESSSMNPAQESAKSAGFVPIMKRNKDGTTTQTFIENGKKVKIIRNQDGKIIKKLVKKVELQAEESSEQIVTVPSEEQTKAKPIIKEAAGPVVEQFEDSLDIFEDVGEYDPFSTTTIAPGTSVRGQGDQMTRQLYFNEEEMTSEVDETSLPTTAKDFLRQNKLALEKAAKLVDAQEKKEQERIAAKRKQDAGFGLVFKDSDAYAGDLREVPDDEEMYDKKRDGGTRHVARTKNHDAEQ